MPTFPAIALPEIHVDSVSSDLKINVTHLMRSGAWMDTISTDVSSELTMQDTNDPVHSVGVAAGAGDAAPDLVHATDAPDHVIDADPDPDQVVADAHDPNRATDVDHVAETDPDQDLIEEATTTADPDLNPAANDQLNDLDLARRADLAHDLPRDEISVISPLGVPDEPFLLFPCPMELAPPNHFPSSK